MKYKYETRTPKLGEKHKAQNFVEPEIPFLILPIYCLNPKEVEIKNPPNIQSIKFLRKEGLAHFFQSDSQVLKRITDFIFVNSPNISIFNSIAQSRLVSIPLTNLLLWSYITFWMKIAIWIIALSLLHIHFVSRRNEILIYQF